MLLDELTVVRKCFAGGREDQLKATDTKGCNAAVRTESYEIP